MATFVLVHGAFYGGWAWKRVREHLRRKGHEVWTPTLTGAGERRHLLGPAVGLGTHIDDVVNVLEYEDLREVCLVGTSYGGMVITGAAGRAASRVAALVYLDAHLPDARQSANGSFAEGTTDVLRAMAGGPAAPAPGAASAPAPAPDAASAPAGPAAPPPGPARDEDWLLPPLPFAATELVRDEDIAWVAPRRVPHPLRTLSDPLPLDASELAPPSITRTYVHCTRRAALVALFGTDPLRPFAEKARALGYRYRELDAGHDAMITAPEEVSALLLEAAGA
ncbi:MAG TPA: alpha/beta hydrolase [Polyangiaceae bacterium]|nr:alpha/beta hydrolase [Polyangiaceae bacterium]